MQKEENHNRADYTPEGVKPEEELSGSILQSSEISTMRAKTAKKSRFFNWLDIVLLVLLVAVVLCIVFRFNPFTGKIVKEATQTVTITVYLPNVDAVFADSIKNGYAVYEDDGGSYIGSVENVETSPACVYAVNGDDAQQTDGGRLNVKVTINVEEARYSAKNGYTVNDVRLAVGAEKQFKFTSFVAGGTIIGLQAESDS